MLCKYKNQKFFSVAKTIGGNKSVLTNFTIIHEERVFFILVTAIDNRLKLEICFL